MPDESLRIHVIADSTGETAARLARACQAQFPHQIFRLIRHPRVTSPEKLFPIFEDIKEEAATMKVAVFTTLVDSVLRDMVAEACREMGLEHIDSLGPALRQLESALGTSPDLAAARPVSVDTDYFTRIAAMEFAIRHDDGQLTHRLKDAEIVIIAASRCGKTPLSMYLGYLGFRTANIPLVAGHEPPKELFEIERWRIVGLTIHPERLQAIRERRVAAMGGRNRRKDGYTDLGRIVEELDEITAIQKRLGAPVLDTTRTALEESAVRIIDIVESRAAAHGAKVRTGTLHEFDPEP